LCSSLKFLVLGEHKDSWGATWRKRYGAGGQQPILLTDEITPLPVLIRAGLEALPATIHPRRAGEPPLYASP
jgi:hypothetical protein